MNSVVTSLHVCVSCGSICICDVVPHLDMVGAAISEF